MKSKLFLIGTALLCLSGFSYSQNPFIRHYTTTNEGLPSNTVYYVFQDSKKFLWFATDAGVVKYDGTTFTNFNKKNGLTSNEVIRIKEDSFGRIWFMNYNGSVDYYYNNKVYNSSKMPFLHSIRGSIFFHDFLQDSDQTIYFYNRVNEVISVNPKNEVRKFKINISSYWNNILRYISKASDGGFILWGNSDIAHLVNFSEKPTFIARVNGVTDVYPTGKQNFIVNNISGGLYTYDAGYQRKAIILPFKAPYSYIKIRSVMEDGEGFLWIVTWDEGAYCLKGGKIIHHFTIPEGQAILQDHENNIWITSMNDGIYKINTSLLYGYHYNSSIFDNKGITALSPDPAEGVWLLNGAEAYFLSKNVIYRLNSKIKGNSLNLIRRLKNALIVGEKGVRFYVFKDIRPDRPTQKVFFRQVITPPEPFNSRNGLKNISINSAGDKISSFGGFTFFIFPADKLFRHYLEVDIKKNIYNTFYNINDDLVINSSINYLFRNETLIPCKELAFLNNRIISDYMMLSEDVELFNVEGDSLFLKEKQNICNLTAFLGSPIDLQVKNIAYHDPDLYISNNNHIYKISNPLQILQKKQVTLQLIDINFSNIHDILVCRDSLYIATDEGLTIIPEALISKIITHTPIPYIQSVQVNDAESDIGDQMIKIMGSAKIKFKPGCINYSSSPVVYSYMLEGSDTAWTTGTATSINYQNLPFGDYVFRLKVCKPNSAWSETLNIRVLIKPRFWQHPAFILFLIFLGVAVISLIIFRIVNNKIKRQKIDHQLILFEQKALQAMMNPHFIFNTLGSIQNYLLQNKSDEAGLYLSQFARLIRLNISSINSSLISLEEEVNRLRIYLDLEQFRMENKFEYVIEFGLGMEEDEVYFPSMLIQPFVENSVWHGISPLDDKGLIRISFSFLSSNALNIIVEDNGIGIKQSARYSSKSEDHLHLTMDVVRKRLEIIGKKMKVKTSLDISEAFPGKPNPGTRVFLTVPFSRDEKEI